MTNYPIEHISSIATDQTSLTELLIDCVNSGASIGFLAPLCAAEATQYWQDVDQAMQHGRSQLFVVRDNDQIIAAVQLGLSPKANAKHRGEVEKLMVKQSHRKQGIATQLMTQLETYAKALELHLLILDTREGDVSEQLYQQLNYTRAGVIPDFALNSNLSYAGTALYYKLIQS